MKTLRIVCWTDSSIVLAWLKRGNSKTILFVTRQVTEIFENAPNAEWHIPGRENPADLLTRGIDALQLIDNQEWWQGPEWLSQIKGNWPTSTECEEEEEVDVCTIMTEMTCPNPFFDYSKCGSWTRLIQITGWVTRFTDNLKQKIPNGSPLTVSELQDAEKLWIRFMQRESFGKEVTAIQVGQQVEAKSRLTQTPCVMDENELLQVKTRVPWSEVQHTATGPWVIDNKHYLSQLIVRDAHVRVFHGGLGDTLAELRQWVLDSTIPHNNQENVTRLFRVQKSAGTLNEAM
uniref:Uncharacterized protein n=1 Tax=Strigamia maritima TaxID=126957 RepID=T1IJE5_STRMM